MQNAPVIYVDDSDNSDDFTLDLNELVEEPK